MTAYRPILFSGCGAAVGSGTCLSIVELFHHGYIALGIVVLVVALLALTGAAVYAFSPVMEGRGNA